MHPTVVWEKFRALSEGARLASTRLWGDRRVASRDVRPHRSSNAGARAIAMTPDELDAFLAEQRTCRVATVGPHGPHATPLWFAWHGGAIWLTSLCRSQRWADLQRDPRDRRRGRRRRGATPSCAGVELRGRVEVVGEVPRTGEPVPELEGPEQLFADRTAAAPWCTTAGTAGSG